MKALLITLSVLNSTVAIASVFYLYYLMKDIAERNKLEEINFSLNLVREKRILTLWQIGDFYFTVFTLIISISLTVALISIIMTGGM